MKVYLCHYNYDYNEWTAAFRTKEEAIEDIAEAFALGKHDDPETELVNGSAEFWEAVRERYEDEDWKGFTFHRLDTETMNLEVLEI